MGKMFEDYKKYNIDITKLKRDYLINPLKYIKFSNNSEKPYKDDLVYLYNELNIRRKEIAKLFNVSDGILKHWLKYYKIQKPINLRMNNLFKYLEANFGTKNISSIEEIKNKKIITYMKHFGTKHPVQSEIIKNKIKNTCNKKYNGHNPTLIGSKEFEERMIEKYGVKSYSQTDNFKKLFKDENFLENWSNKLISSKKGNNTFNTSKPEEESYNLLIQKYPNTIRQYKSDLYPFNCDLYVPELDLYIELNYHWTHGGEPYIGSDIQKEKIKHWEEKSKEINAEEKFKKYYTQAIYVWTNLDVKKKEIMIKNNLNFLIFYDIIKFKEWFQGLL